MSLKSSQAAGGHVHELDGKVRLSRFDYTADGSEGVDDVIELCLIPSGRLVVLGDESLCSISGIGAGNVGHGEFTNADGSIQPAQDNRFGDMLVGPAAHRLLGSIDIASITDFDALKPVTIEFTVKIALADGEKISGYIAYVVS